MIEQILTFPYTGVLFNSLIVAVGALIGLIARKGIPSKITDALLCGMGLCTLYAGAILLLPSAARSSRTVAERSNASVLVALGIR